MFFYQKTPRGANTYIIRSRGKKSRKTTGDAGGFPPLLTTFYELLTFLFHFIRERHVRDELVLADRNLRSDRSVAAPTVGFCRHGLCIHRVISSVAVAHYANERYATGLGKLCRPSARFRNGFIAGFLDELIALVEIERESGNVGRSEFADATEKFTGISQFAHLYG